MKNISFSLEPQNNDFLNNLCGQTNENIHTIESHLAVEIGRRGYDFKIFGPQDAIDQASKLVQKLYQDAAKGSLNAKELAMTLQSMANQEQRKDSVDQTYFIKTLKGPIKPRTPNQSRYIKRMAKNNISFGVGPAGTGKTFLAVAAAVQALEQEQVKRLILVRPAVEAGENLGFLPGDLAQKVDPYLRPIYDALYELMGTEKVLKLIGAGLIEVAPLAFMRGRNLNEAFIILDESQNTTREQMKMFLTRMGFGSTVVVTGDITQIDLPRGTKSGLRHVINVLNGVEGISFTFFDHLDVVRHPLVQRIVEAYESEAAH